MVIVTKAYDLKNVLSVYTAWQWEPAKTGSGRRICGCLVMPRYTEPNPEQALLLHELKLVLPQQPPPRITAASPMAIPQIQM